MTTQTSWKNVCAAVVAAWVMGTLGTALGAWTNVTYEAGSTPSNVNGGTNTDGYYYTSTKPSTGAWTANYTLACTSYLNHTENIWSATGIGFFDWNVRPNNTAVGTELVLKVELSELIGAATWTVPGTDNTYAVHADYSTNGVDWTTAWNYANGQGGNTVPLTTGNTDQLYVRLISTSGWWIFGDSGTFTFTAVPEPASLALLGLGALAVLRRRRR